VCCECEISQELTNYLDEYLETNESAKVTKKLVRKWYTNHRKYADDDEWCDITKHLDFAVKWATRVVDKYHEEQEEEATTPGKRKTIGGKAPRSHNQPASDKKKDKSDRKAEQTPNKKATIKMEPASAGKRGSAPRTNHAKKTPKKKTPQKTQEYYLNYTSSYSF
jgi:cell division protein FtsN